MSDNLNLRNYLASQMGNNHLVQEIARLGYFSRNMKVLLEKHLKDYLFDKSEERWIVIPGLRGVGKTTLIAQVYRWAYEEWVAGRSDSQQLNMIYISLDVVRNLGGNLLETLGIYESILASRLENTARPVLLFIDEIQIDSQWARVLKTVYDRTGNVFMICTGSSATYLQMDADTAGRRAKIERLYPLNFIEYQLLSNKKFPVSGLKKQIVDACYHSGSAFEVYEKLKKIRPKLDQAWGNYDPNQIENYLQIGTMPFALKRNKSDVYKALLDNIDKVVAEDLVTGRRFNFSRSSTITIKQLLIFLANSSTTPSLNSLADRLKTDIKNLSEMFTALIKAEALIRVPAYGNGFSTVTKPVRYYFMSAALRTAYWDITGNSQTAESRREQLLEDVAVLHYYKEFAAQAAGSLSYVYSKQDLGNCNFICKVANNRQIALEFGLGNKTARQVELTMATVPCDYGLVFSGSDLKLNENVVLIPLRYFFLM